MPKKGPVKWRGPGRPLGHGPKILPSGLTDKQALWLRREASRLQPKTSGAALLRSIIDEHIARIAMERSFGKPVEGLPLATPNSESTPEVPGG